MERAITGSVSPSAALDPVALPSASRSKRGASIDGIPSFGGPPDLIPANARLCLEKSVRGHSKRQLIGSADKVPRLASTNRPKTAVSAINLGNLSTNDANAIHAIFRSTQRAARGQFGLIASSVNFSSA